MRDLPAAWEAAREHRGVLASRWGLHPNMWNCITQSMTVFHMAAGTQELGSNQSLMLTQGLGLLTNLFSAQFFFI